MDKIKCFDFAENAGMLLSEFYDLTTEELDRLNDLVPNVYDWVCPVGEDDRYLGLYATDADGGILKSYDSFDSFEADALRFLGKIEEETQDTVVIGNSADPYEIRIHFDDNARWDDDTYCASLDDLKVRAFYPTANDLMRGWYDLFDEHAGDAYSVLDHGEVIMWGAYDPDDDLSLISQLYSIDDEHIPVTVYASETGLYTERECDADNITTVRLLSRNVWKWFDERILPYCQGDYYSFAAWYHDDYDADETSGLCEYAVAHGDKLERPDGLKRSDVELGEKVYDTLFDCPWWDAPSEDDCIRSVLNLEACKKLVDHLLDIINRKEA